MNICTLSKFQFEDCRKCDNPSEQRCNDGQCIDKAVFNNDTMVGCLDGSDIKEGRFQ